MNMYPFRRILAGIDFSPSSDEALRQGYQRAVSTGAKLAVCHIVPDELRSNVLFPHLSRRDALAVPIEAEQAAKALLGRVTAVVGESRPETEIDIISDHGTPAAEILRRAEDWKADLIVVGSQGMTSSAGVFLGGVTSKIIRYAHSAVLVARASHGNNRIIAGTDFSDPAFPAISAAVEEARRTQGSLMVVHCIEATLAATTPAFTGTGVMMPLFTAEDYAEMEKLAKQKLAEAIAKLNAKADLLVTGGPPAASLLTLASEQKADLIVVGTVGRTGVARVLLGSVAETVASRAPCSVLVVRKH